MPQDETGESRFRVVRWIVRNKFLHIRTFMQPVLDSGHVPARLKSRIQRRVVNAQRLVVARAGVYAILVVAAVGSVLIGLTNALAARYTAFVTLVVYGAILFSGSLGVVALALLNRSLGIIEAEIYVLSMHAMSHHVHSGGLEEPHGDDNGNGPPEPGP